MITPDNTIPESFKDLCQKYDATVIQKLYKKITGKDGNLVDKDVFPVALVQSIYDAISGMRLDDILTHYNYIHIGYKGTEELTRLAVPIAHRRSKLVIQYTDYEGNTRIEQYIRDTINDEDWKNTNNWKTPFTEGNFTVHVTKEELIEAIDKEELNRLIQEAIDALDLEQIVNNNIDEAISNYLKTKDDLINETINNYLNDHLSEDQLNDIINNAIQDKLLDTINSYFTSEEGKEILRELINDEFGPQIEETVGDFFNAIVQYVQDNERVIANALARHEQAITDLQNA